MGLSGGSSGRFRAVWSVGALAYGVIRVALAGAFLREYGLNIWAFAAVEIASSALLATAGGRLIGSFAHTTRGRRDALGLATLTAYAAPDVYVLVFAGQFPTGTLVVVVGVIAVGAVASILSVVVQLRKARLAAAIVR